MAEGWQEKRHYRRACSVRHTHPFNPEYDLGPAAGTPLYTRLVHAGIRASVKLVFYGLHPPLCDATITSEVILLYGSFLSVNPRCDEIFTDDRELVASF